MILHLFQMVFSLASSFSPSLLFEITIFGIYYFISSISLILFLYRNKNSFFKKEIKDQIEFNKEKTQRWIHPHLLTFQEKINKIDKKGISLVHIKTMDELSTKILINQAKDKNTKVLDINLLDESNSFSLVSFNFLPFIMKNVFIICSAA